MNVKITNDKVYQQDQITADIKLTWSEMSFC